MPQFDPTSYIVQIIWLLICFNALWAFMHWKVIPTLHEIMSAREEALKKIIIEAQFIHQEAESILQENQEKLDRARQDAADIIQKIAIINKKKVQKHHEEMRVVYKAKLSELQRNVKKEKKELIATMDKMAIPFLNLFLKNQKEKI
jgi:F0F1-type ATP synthase membrane subunit b/b'